jgi:diguanylate cyclase (GGDEF)-like protein
MTGATKIPSDETARRRALAVPPTTGPRAWITRLTEPYVLFPFITVLLLAVVWGATFNLIKVERSNATRASAATTLEVVSTYEAQVVRALSQIDQTLKLVKFEYETKGSGANAANTALSELKSRTMLPSDLLFVISIINRDGKIVASTRPIEASTAAEPALLQGMRSDALWINRPRKGAAPNQWTLQFGRALNAADGAIAGAVLLEVDAANFVSSYDRAILGNNGVLGLLGTDGVFRARRTGNSVSAGGTVDYANTVPGGSQDDSSVSVSVNSWDGVRRFTAAQQLSEYPLAVIAGLSEREQLAAALNSRDVFLWRAALISGFIVLLGATLGRMSWQLSQARQRESEAKLAYALRVEHLAYHDSLTALPNRSLFNRLLSQAIRAAQRHNRQLAVAFIDLDQFKLINDTIGHEAGDHLLREVASRLTGCVRESDTIARLGGDEFVLLLTELSEEKHAATVAQKIVTVLARPFVLLGQEFSVTASIGISTYPLDGLDERTLMKNADIAMYHAKEAGKNNFRFYCAKLNANSLERLTLESSLRHALERNEFELYYQARRDIRNDRITGVEALLRWRHPELGIVPPSQFISLAEDTGLIVPIGKWVLQTACQQNVAWQRRGLPRLSIAVNLTARQFYEEHLLRDATSILASTGMQPGLLELEIHESLLIRNIDKTLQILTGLKALGIRIAIDNFGAGYSSLAALQRFPLDTIKIDRSFIRDLSSPGKDSDVTAAIIAMGKSLSPTVVAQGVETKEQADFLRKHACDECQGFYFNKPLSIQQFTELLYAQTKTDMTDKGSRAKQVVGS